MALTLLRCLFASWLLLAALPEVCAEPQVVLVSSERGYSYSEAVEAFKRELERAGVNRQNILDRSLDEPIDTTGASLIVALGARAAEQRAAHGSKVPLLCALLPRASFERILQKNGKRTSSTLSALYLDQPIGRQLDLIRLGLPKARFIGLLTGPGSQAELGDFRSAIAARGFQAVVAHVEAGEPLFPGLKTVLDDADVLLALPDPQIYNSNSIQSLLLASFRAKVPMVAFSSAYVRAGALLAVYSTPAQIGRQAAVMALGVLGGRPLPASGQYPTDFSVSANEHVARSLDLDLDAPALNDRLRALERRP